MKKAAFFILFVLVSGSCTRVTFPNTQKKDPNAPFEYEEDISVVRPRYEPKIIKKSTPKPIVSAPVANDTYMNVSSRVDAALDAIAVKSQTVAKYAQGFRIQVYVGISRQDVDNAKVTIYQTLPELSPYMSFSQPTYKLKVGDFLTRLDAERYLKQIKGQFPAAIILSDRVEVKKSLYIK